MVIATSKDAEEMALFMAHVLDSLQASVIMCDSDLKIVAINSTAWKVLRRLGPEVRAEYGVDVAQLVGMPLRRFLTEPSRLEAILGDPALLPHTVELSFGPMDLQVRIDALRAPEGEISGYAMVCEDVSRLRAAEDARDAALRQRAALLHEVRGRVKRSLRLASDLARLENGAAAGSDAAPGWAARLGSLSRVHERIYASDDVSRIDLDAFVRGLIQDAAAAHPAAASRIRIETAVHARIGDIDRLIAFGMVVTELVTNAMKHGFPDGRPGLIRVTARSVDGAVEAVVSDDGVGLGAPSRAGLGLKIVCALIERRLKGELRVESGGGTACLFTIPAETVDAGRPAVMGSLRPAAGAPVLGESR
jgi:two-component sensor histidine kinase